jgi:hypothetical protein
MRGILSIIIAVLLLVGFPMLASAAVPSVTTVYDGVYAQNYGYYIYYEGSAVVHGTTALGTGENPSYYCKENVSVRSFTDWQYYKLSFSPNDGTPTLPNDGSYKPINLLVIRSTGLAGSYYPKNQMYLQFNLEGVYVSGSTTDLKIFRQVLYLSTYPNNVSSIPWNPDYCNGWLRIGNYIFRTCSTY